MLYLIGRDVESILGQKHFRYLYLSGIVGGELSHLFLMPADTVLLAASGRGLRRSLPTYATILPELGVADTLFFFAPFKLKAKYLGYALFACGLALTIWLRHGVVSHSAYLGGGAAGWLYAHLLGLWPALVSRNGRCAVAGWNGNAGGRMPLEEFIAAEIDPLLERFPAAVWRA